MQHGIEFDAIKQHIQYNNHFSPWSAFLTIVSCFAHIINLACKAVLTAITNIDYANDHADFIPQPGQPTNFMAACRHDPIATAHSIVQLVSLRSIITILDSLMFPFQICGSSLRC